MSAPEASSFIIKTFKMINRCHDPEPPEEPGQICSWSDEGDSFIIKDTDRFTDLLPHYFKHRNFRSFVRQLNFYGFRKVRSESTNSLYPTRPPDWSEFKHEYFLRDQPELLGLIKRTGSGGGGASSDSAAKPPPTAQEVSELDDMRHRIQQLEQQVTMLSSMVATIFASRNSALPQSHELPQATPAETRKRSRGSSSTSIPNVSGGLFQSGTPRSGSRDGSMRQLEGVPLASLNRPTTSIEVLKEILTRGSMDSAIDLMNTSFASLNEEDMRALMASESAASPAASQGLGTGGGEAAVAAMATLSRRRETGAASAAVGATLNTGPGNGSTSMEGLPLKRSRSSIGRK